MKAKFLRTLEKAGLIRKNRLQVDSVWKMSFSRLVDLLDAATADTLQAPGTLQPTLHTYCASLGMGGGRDECCFSDCRLRELSELARFCALYSDQTIIHNFLANYAPSWGHPPKTDSDDFRFHVADDIGLLLFLRPLIDAEKIIVFSPPAQICPYCYAKILLGSKADRRLERALTLLSNDLYEQMPVEFYQDELGYCAAYRTPGSLFRSRSHLMVFDEPPKPITSRPRLMKRIRDGNSIALSKQVRRELGLHADLAEDVLISLRYQMSVADAIGASFATNRDVDARILSYVSQDANLDRRNVIAAKFLRSIVPFAGDVPVDRLLRLRKREEEAFIRFRSALDSVLKEVLSSQGDLSERQARSLYSDLIAPEIARLDRRVKEAKRDLIRAPLASAAGATAMITFGLYSGMVPAEIKQIASVLGLAKVAYDTASKAVQLADVNKSIRPDKFYFLWRVKNLARKASSVHTGGWRVAHSSAVR